MKPTRPTAAVLVLLAAVLPVLAQPRPGTAELPVTRIVLFSSGVGYFQREGQVEGTTRIDLQFQTANINDLLKSLVLQDEGGGQISTVNYDNRDPVEKTLKSFAIDLTSNPSVGDLLNQVRGERVEILTYGEPGKEGVPTNLTGTIVGVQKQRKPVGKEQVIETEQLNLLTHQGLEGTPLEKVQRVHFLKPELQKEFRQALEALATGHDKQKKTVSLNFLGNGKRQVRVGYVTESPLWKTSYRLSLTNEMKNSGPGTWGMLNHGGPLSWPVALRGDDFREQRERINALAHKAVKQVESDNPVDGNTERQLLAAIQTMQQQLRRVSSDLRFEQYRDAKLFLDNLEEAVRALRKRNGGTHATRAFLQGWAIVENTSDEDWNQVSMGLVSGRPISFQMDLYQPLYVPRPVVEPELFASLRPQTYGGNLEQERAARLDSRRRVSEEALYEMSKTPAAAALRAGLGGRNAGEGQRGLLRQLAEKSEGRADRPLNFQQGVASAAIATELGEYFKYELEQPVSLPRQKSALLPIVNQPVEASRVSIYNESVHPKFPLLGLRFKNTTGLHLMQGPVTVFEANTYAGDARIADLQPNETRLLSYAVDLGTEVSPEAPNPADNLVAVKVYKGILHATHKVRFTKDYTVKNRSQHERNVLIEHPYRADLKLVRPEKPAERTRDLYRFEVKAEPNQPVKLEVVEEQQRVDQLALTSSDDDTVRLFLRASASSPQVKQALAQALKLRAELAEKQQAMAREEQALHVIEQDQARMRANMERVPRESHAYQRYLKKFDDQETEIEQRRARVSKLQESAEQQRQAYEQFVLNLNVE